MEIAFFLCITDSLLPWQVLAGLGWPPPAADAAVQERGGGGACQLLLRLHPKKGWPRPLQPRQTCLKRLPMKTATPKPENLQYKYSDLNFYFLQRWSCKVFTSALLCLQFNFQNYHHHHHHLSFWRLPYPFYLLKIFLAARGLSINIVIRSKLTKWTGKT